jgi:hypothetical protein
MPRTQKKMLWMGVFFYHLCQGSYYFSSLGIRN